MFASLRIHTVFKRTPNEQKPPRARSGHGAASVIPYLKAEQDSRFAEPWSVLKPFDDSETGVADSG